MLHSTRFSVMVLSAAGLLGATTLPANAALLIGNIGQTSAGTRGKTPNAQAFINGPTKMALDSIQFASTGTVGKSVSIWSRNQDGTIGTSLANVPITAFANNTATATPSAAFDFQPNTGYWIEVTISNGTSPLWQYTTSTTYTANSGVSIPTNHTTYDATNGYKNLSDNDLYLFNVNTHAVPEPGSLALIGLGAMGLLAMRRRRPTAE